MQAELNDTEVAITAPWPCGSNCWHLAGQNSAGIGVSSTDRHDDSAAAASSKLPNASQVSWLFGLIPHSNSPIIPGPDRLAPARSNFP